MAKHKDPASKEERRIERMVIGLTPEEKQALEAYAAGIERPLGTWARGVLIKAAGHGVQS